MEEAPAYMNPPIILLTGATDKPKLYVPVYDGDELQPSLFAEVGAHGAVCGYHGFHSYNGPARCESAAGTGL